MNTKQPTDGLGVHHGRNIRNARIKRNLKQEALADLVHMTQQNVSRYEATKTIDDKTLEKFAKALDVSLEDLKTTQDLAPWMIENHNTYTENATVTGVNQGSYWGDPTFHTSPTVHPLDKMVELFERMLKERDEQIKILTAKVAEGEKNNRAVASELPANG